MKFTYYGHACFAVEAEGQTLLFDPFITGNPLAKSIDVDKVAADYILLSHGHADHVADVEAIAQRTGAVVLAPFEVGTWFEKKGVKNIQSLNPGGTASFDFGKVKLTNAIHSSSMPDGSYGGSACGLVVENGEDCFYFAGDTALMEDMKLIGAQFKLTFAVLPIGGHFTMDLADALIAADFVGTKRIVGVHFDTFPPIRIDHAEALRAAEKAGKELILPKIGETIDA
jgi:L-ascorbate metabolism protein UlaG (beta-lactamase superfamily)